MHHSQTMIFYDEKNLELKPKMALTLFDFKTKWYSNKLGLDLKSTYKVIIFCNKFDRAWIRLGHRDTLIEATSSQKVRATKVSCGDQGGEVLQSLKWNWNFSNKW